MSQTPLITIVGVPNTGKSTFFNRLIGQKKALTHSKPGMTRDIYKKPFHIDDKLFYLQDSGGFFLDEDIITEEINKRIFKEVKRSQLVIFLFDGKREMLGYEKDLYLQITRSDCKIIPVINKVDNPNKYLLPNSYYELKLDFFFTSAEHNIGFDEVLDAILENLSFITKTTDNTDENSPRISIVGKPNVGKSSIINKILMDDFVIVSPIPGTTRDSVDLEILRKKKKYIFVDNAGIRKLQKVKEDTESAAVIRAEKDIRNSDIIIFVLDVSRKIDQNDMFIAQKVLKAAKPIIIACNKWDLVEEKWSAEALIKKIRTRLNFFFFSPIMFVSAISGKNVFKLFDLIEDLHEKTNKKIKTSHVNEVIQNILKEKKLMTTSNQRFNPKYISIESYQPFFINFFTHSSSKLKASFERYLKKRIVEELDLEGIPVFIKTTGNEKKNSAK